MRSSAEYDSSSFVGRNRKHTFLILLLVFIVGTALALSGRQGTVTAQLDGEKLGVVGSYGAPVFVSLDEITGVLLTEELDPGVPVDGEESGKTMCGTYENDGYGVYELRIYTRDVLCIVVTYGDGETLVFNQSTRKQTRSMYEDMMAELGSR